MYYSFGKIIKQLNFTHKPTVFKHSDFLRIKETDTSCLIGVNVTLLGGKKFSVGKQVENVKVLTCKWNTLQQIRRTIIDAENWQSAHPPVHFTDTNLVSALTGLHSIGITDWLLKNNKDYHHLSLKLWGMLLHLTACNFSPVSPGMTAQGRKQQEQKLLHAN